jgi:hypothetical protein
MLRKYNNNIIYPDYDNCIVNLISSVLSSYSVNTNHKPLTQVDPEKLKSKSNIVLLVFDGLGYDYLMQYFKNEDSILYDNCITDITTVFPSTTSSVITSILTCKTPIEHGILGWTLYFKEYQRFIDYLPNKDHFTQKELYHPTFDVHGLMKHENIFQKIKKANSNTKIFNVIPQDLSSSRYNISYSQSADIIPYNHTNEMFNKIEELIKTDADDKKFIYGYSINPDAILHKFGIGSREAFSYVNKMDFFTKKLTQKLKGTNTTIIITADHGLTDVRNYFYIDKDKELYDCLIMPTFPEPRFISFFVKPHKQKQFERIFKREFKDKMLLFDRKTFLREKILGNGIPHYKVDDFIGNYIGIGIGDLGIKTLLKHKFIEDEKDFPAHHAGLTSAEILIPLIMIDIE